MTEWHCLETRIQLDRPYCAAIWLEPRRTSIDMDIQQSVYIAIVRYQCTAHVCHHAGQTIVPPTVVNLVTYLMSIMSSKCVALPSEAIRVRPTS